MAGEYAVRWGGCRRIHDNELVKVLRDDAVIFVSTTIQTGRVKFNLPKYDLVTKATGSYKIQ